MNYWGARLPDYEGPSVLGTIACIRPTSTATAPNSSGGRSPSGDELLGCYVNASSSIGLGRG
eukprot:10173664-Alexandrium_andersonii.AAC.1